MYVLQRRTRGSSRAIGSAPSFGSNESKAAGEHKTRDYFTDGGRGLRPRRASDGTATACDLISLHVVLDMCSNTAQNPRMICRLDYACRVRSSFESNGKKAAV